MSMPTGQVAAMGRKLYNADTIPALVTACRGAPGRDELVQDDIFEGVSLPDRSARTFVM